MTTIFTEIGSLCVALILAMYFQLASVRSKSEDCKLFSWLLISTAAVLIVDTFGWVIDGNPIAGQIWITTVIDGLDLMITTLVCWCWLQYARYIINGKPRNQWIWYKDFATWLLLVQALLIVSSQIFGFYYRVDEMGVYHRESGYIIHTLLSLGMLGYSSFSCLKAYGKENNSDKKSELLFVAFVIFIPICGNIFQFFVYGYPTVWLCMVFMIFVVYIHIQNKRNNAEREKQNQQLQMALDEAQIANHAKTDFLARMSHDMRTPMNGILGITTLLRDRTDPVEIRSDVDQIEKSGRYLLNLINDTLDMSKIESGKMELHPAPINSEVLFENVITTTKILAAQKDVKLNIEWPTIAHDQWIPVIADASRVEQIFMNLITNAVKFTPSGGSVTVHMDSIKITSESVIDRYIISDTGIGMTKEFQEHLFEPFSQESRGNTDYESGTGLGLAIVKQIIDLMGGQITIDSTVNVGTTITIYLSYPRYHGTLEHHSEQHVDLEILKDKCVLLCEDHPINATIAIRLLEKKGMRVDLAENGQVGVDKFAHSQEGYYSAILMDIRMPIMNGLEATRIIRSMPHHPDAQCIPIIAMTANAFDDDILECKKAGMDAHLAKPTEAQQLYEELARQISK